MKTLKILLLWVGTFALAMVSCTQKSKPAEEDPQTLRKNLDPIQVEVAVAQVRPFTYYVRTSGKIVPAQIVEVRAKTSGIIEKRFIVNGQRVSKAQKLIQLENDLQELALEKAQVQHQTAQLKYQSDLIAFGSDEELNNERGEQIKRNVKHNSGLQATQVALKEAQLSLRYTSILSNISGVVSDLTLTEGNQVSIGDKLCTIYNPSTLQLEVEVIESEVAKLQVGLSAAIRPLGLDTLSYRAQVSEINPAVNTKTGMVKVKLRLSQTSNLLPGMNATAVIDIPYDKHIIVPKQAVVMRSSKPVVFTFENKLAKWNYVTLGRDNGQEVEILDGLQADQQVITTNNLQLAHDTQVALAK